MTTLIFGHRSPDTDSITSAISLSYLKNQLGLDSEPRALGKLSKETKYILDYFGVEEPKFLDNVKVQLKDLKLEQVDPIKEDTSIYTAFSMMQDDHIKVLPVLDDNKKLLGVVTMKDIAIGIVNKNMYRISNSIESINNDLKGRILVKAQDCVDGNIKIASLYHETIQGRLTGDDVIITGDRYDIFVEAIKSRVKLIIVTGGLEVPEEYIKSAKKNGVSIILVNQDTFTIAKLINQTNKTVSIMNKNIIKFTDDEYLVDVKDEIEESKVRSFPVVDSENTFLGFVNRGHIINPQKKQVILVDHNEYEQSADGLRQAEIIQVVDHHKVGNISTSVPIDFTIKPIGCTCTLIYNMYKENNVEIPKEIAGMMISGIISDTLLFRSPTTTDIDRLAVEGLNEILNLDLETYAMDVFKAGTSLEGFSIEEIFYRDFKQFEIDSHKIGVGQVFTLDIDEILDRKDEYLEFMEKAHEQNEFYLTLLVITDILKEGSYILFKSSKSRLIERAFDVKEEQGVFIEGLVSRKKQVVPNITKALEL